MAQSYMKRRQETASPLASPLPKVITEKQINAEDVQETFVNNKNMYALCLIYVEFQSHPFDSAWCRPSTKRQRFLRT